MIIRKVFDGEFDEEVHSGFLKFGRGDYKYKFLIEVKKQKDKWAIKTSAEFSNFLVKRCLEKISGEVVAIKGIIVTTKKLEDGEIGFEIKKRSNFQGIRKLQIDIEIEPSKILELMEKYPRMFFALSFKGQDFDLKIKAKAPKSGKPGKEDGEVPKADFCSLKTPNKELVKELLFDIQDMDNFKEININHLLQVKEIVYPKDVASLKPEEIRENSKRKGVLIRNIEIDGKSREKQAEFEA